MKFSFISILLLGLNVNAALSVGSSVHVRSVSESSGPHLLLGEIAEISAPTTLEENKLSRIDLGESPTLGKTFEWTAEEVSQKLRPYLTTFKGVQLTFPEKAIIGRKSPEITAGAVKQKIEEVVRSQLPDPSWEFEVSEVSLPPVVKEMKVSGFQVIPPLSRAKGQYSFELIAIEHALPKRFWITARVKYFASVGTLLRQINAHSRFVESDLNWQRKDVTFQIDVPATVAETKVGLSRMNLSPGTTLLKSQLEREMALHFGDQVDLMIGDEAISVVSKGVAQQNAFIGDTIKVRSLTTNKMLDGIVTARGVVNVRY